MKHAQARGTRGTFGRVAHRPWNTVARSATNRFCMSPTSHGMSRTNASRITLYPPAEQGPAELNGLSKDTGINAQDLARQIWAAGLTWARRELAPRIQEARATLTPQTPGPR